MTTRDLGQWLGRFFDRVGVALKEFPSTNGRIIVTLLIYVATAAVYLFIALLHTLFGLPLWEPSAYWLMFIGMMSGIDTAHFRVKRRTAFPPAATPPADGATT